MINVPNPSASQFAGIIRATGLDSSGVSDNRVSLQAQWDAAAAAGKSLLISDPGTYKLTSTGSSSTRRCLSLTDSTKRYGLMIGPGVILKCADSQGSDGNPVKMIYFSDHTGGLYVGWPFGGRGGTLYGNTANQPGWTTASGDGGTRYGQMLGYSAIFGNDTLNGGSNDITLENFAIDDWFSNNLAVGYHLSIAYGNGTEHVYCRKLKTTNCGEGIVLSCVNYFDIWDSLDIRAVGKMMGDSFEPSGCQYGTVSNCKATSGGVEVVTGGAAVDVYASRHVTVSDIIAEGCRNVITLESDFSDVDNYCDNITVTNVIGKGIGSTSPTTAVIPSQGGRSTFTNCRFENYHTAGLNLTSQTPGDGSVAELSMTNCDFYNCAGFNIDYTSGDLRMNLNNVNIKVETQSPLLDYAVAINRASGSKSLSINWHGGELRGFNTAGLRFAGNSGAAPSGVLKDIRYVLSGGANPWSVQSGVSTLYLDNDKPASIGTVSATTNTIYGFYFSKALYWDSSGGHLETLPVGQPYQEVTLLFIFDGGQVRDWRANGYTGNIQLAGAAHKTFARYDTLTLRYCTQDSLWYEVSRSINS